MNCIGFEEQQLAMRFPLKFVRALLIASIFLSVAIAFLTHSLSMRYLLFGDSLYIPTLFKDIFIAGGNFLDWNFPGAPYFFPDMALLFPIMAFVKDTYFATLVYALIQIGITYLLILLPMKLLSTSQESEAHTYTLEGRFDISLFTFLCSIVLWATQNHSEIAEVRVSYQPYFRILSSVFHFGNIINTLFAVAIVIALLEKKVGLLGYTSLFIVSVLGTSSDALFIVGFTAPSVTSILLVFAIFRSNFSVNLKTISTLLAGTAAGVILKFALTTASTSNYILANSDLLGQLKALGTIIFLSIRDMPVVMLFIVSFYVMLIWKIGNTVKTRRKVSSHFYLYSFILISVIYTFIALVINGVLVASRYGMTRYFLNFYWFPILFSWLIYDAFFQSRSWHFRRIRNSSFLIALLLSSYNLIPRGAFRGSYYPPIAQCVDTALVRYELTTTTQLENGISSYVLARTITEFSKRDISIFQVLPDLSPSFWVNNRTHYRSLHDFAVISQPFESTPNLEVLEKINGTPEYEFSCKDTERTKVLIYGKDELRTEKFLDVGDRYAWKACELLIHNSSVAQEDCSVTTQPKLTPGIVTFGPYESLPKGRYRFNIQYSSPAVATELIGEWDVIITSAEQSVQLQKGNLNGTSNQGSEVSGTFEVSEEYADGQIQVRTSINGSSPLTVFELDITKVG